MRSTPMLEQYWALKREVPGALLLYRLGDFYELFFEDAVKAAPLLGLVLTRRHRDSDIEAPMCGIPYHAADSYIAKLVSAGERVAIAEQTEPPSKGKTLVARKVVRVVTPGTHADPDRLDARRNNDLCALAIAGEEIGAAFLDVTTGDFSAVSFPSALLGEVFRRRSPREVVAPEVLIPRLKTLLADLPGDPPSLCPAPSSAPLGQKARELLLRHFKTETLEPFGIAGLGPECDAAATALGYARSMQRSELANVVSLRIERLDDGLVVDSVTASHLELFRSLRDGGRTGTLLGLIDETGTAFGARALRRMLERPLGRKAEIDARLEAVSDLLSDATRLERLARGLSGLPDVPRLLGRLSAGTGLPRDLLGLCLGMKRGAELAPILGNAAAAVLSPGGEASPTGVPAALAEEVLALLVPDPPATAREGGIFRDGVDASLDEMRLLKRDSASVMARIEAEEREARGIPNLRIKFNQVFGHVFEVAASARNRIPAEAVKRQTLANVERYATRELVEIDEKIRSADSRINDREAALFSQVVEKVLGESPQISEAWARLARLDALVSLARVARSRRWVRPVLVDDPVLEVQEGRHPVVEALRPREPFVPNDLSLSEEKRVVVLTGPNMGGKSTYLRQNALIVLLAHAGSFVPAASARIGMCDRIFTRVGASDSLARGESTFFVEMSETAHILRQATRKSLVVLDEIGRGTSTFDGLSLAWAIAERLHDGEDPLHPGPARVLFATHYHELTELAIVKPGVGNFTMAVKEWQGEVVFLRRVSEGTADRSYGVQVARLAGIPEPVFSRAREILRNLERQQLDLGGRPRLAEHSTPEPAPSGVQLDLFQDQTNVVLDTLSRIDIDALTPLAALNILASLQSRLKGEA
ncbi:MAG: DNA mismatch repair protein MutS [Thermoanaerobaculia bacterium]|nr:DNA mismatch repair protein MutS [Thermoanaerobaculia bacterium]